MPGPRFSAAPFFEDVPPNYAALSSQLDDKRYHRTLKGSAPRALTFVWYACARKSRSLVSIQGWTFGLRVQRANHDPGIHVCPADVETQGCSSVAASVGLKPKVRFRDPRHRRFPCVAFCKNCHAQGKEAQKEQESSSSTRRPRQNMFERGLKVCQTFVARSKKADSTLRSSQAVPHPSTDSFRLGS